MRLSPLNVVSSHLLSSFLPFLPFFLFSFLPFFLSSFLPSFLPFFFSFFFHVSLSFFPFFFSLPFFLSSFLFFLSSCLPFFLSISSFLRRLHSSCIACVPRMHADKTTCTKVFSKTLKGSHVVPEETKACGVAQDVDHDASWRALLSEGLLSGRFRQLEVHSTFTSRAHPLTSTCAYEAAREG